MKLKIRLAIAKLSDASTTSLFAALVLKMCFSAVTRLKFRLRQNSMGSTPYMSGRIGISRDTPSS